MKRFMYILVVWCIGITAYGQVCNPEAAWLQFKLLQGNWKIENQTSIESWKLVNDTLMQGKVYKITNKDTILTETIHLVLLQNKIIYKPRVKSQNRENPVEFELKHCIGNTFIFENSDRDFTQKIGYRFINPTTLLAWKEGTQNGKNIKTDFPMKKTY